MNEPGETEIQPLNRKNLAKHTHEILRSMAETDELTGLKSRRALKKDWERADAFLKRGELSYKFLYADLDRFKNVNDIDESHALGDGVLRKAAETLSGIVRSEDSVGRLGGDEFGILIVGHTFESDKEIQEKFEERFKGKFKELVGPELWSKYPQIQALGVSVGVADPTESDSFETISKRADKLMYKRKADKGEER